MRGERQRTERGITSKNRSIGGLTTSTIRCLHDLGQMFPLGSRFQAQSESATALLARMSRTQSAVVAFLRLIDGSSDDDYGCFSGAENVNKIRQQI